jgi:hypothetical protein
MISRVGWMRRWAAPDAVQLFFPECGYLMLFIADY